MSSSTAPLRVALFGLGRMGSHHLNAIRERNDLRLIAVADHGSERAREAADAAGCAVVPEPSALVGEIDLAVVAVPTTHHREVAESLLSSGVACLVEKPIAAHEADARALIAAAERGGAVLRVGHVERFNPAVRVALELLADELASGGALRIAARRANPPSERTFDVDAVLDLMIHDLDLVGLIAPGAIDRVDSVPADQTFDRTHATLSTSGGTEVELTVDRRAESMVRDLVIETATQRVHVDYAARTVRRRALATEHEDVAVDVPASDPLRSQLDACVRAVRGDGAAYGADGRAGLAALALAERVRAAAGLTAGSR